jgi:isopentenyldiphosphate isomerase
MIDATQYYKQKQMIARVDRHGKVLGEIEKWEAHKNGILHLGFTVALLYDTAYIVQHRKHPVFDGVFDISFSSHQLFVDGVLQKTTDALYDALKREWNVNPEDLTGVPREDGAVCYQARDPYSQCSEHEYCVLYSAAVKKLPVPNFDFAYGYSLVAKEELTRKNSRIYKNLAPWVHEMIDKKFIVINEQKGRYLL